LPQALPGVSTSSPPTFNRSGLLRVVSPAELDARDRQRLADVTAARQTPPPVADLGAFVRQRWMAFRNHRNTGSNSINERLLRAQRMFEGKYDPAKLTEIRKFGGSEVYSRLVAVKCRGATSLLRDVYLGMQRPWDVTPQPDPPVPPDIRANILQLLSSEVMGLQQAGQPILPDQVHTRLVSLMHAAQQAARRVAISQASAAADKINDILKAGGFYDALAEFLVDLPLFPYACIKGPVVRMAPKLVWINGQPSMRQIPQMFWDRIDPFNLYWSPGVAHIEDAEMIERQRLTRTNLNDLIGLPGYDEVAVRGALQDYDHGLRDWLDAPDTEEALNAGRESPTFNQSHMIDAVEYHGNVQGHTLLNQGVDPAQIPDLDRDYVVQTWVVGRWTLKTQLSPSPRRRHPYYVTSFEKVPGTTVGHGLPDILEDLQEIANASLRSLVNNLAISSGPQVVINDDRLVPTEQGDQLYPWKRWHIIDEPTGSQREAVTFFQPQSNSQELLSVYSAISGMADDNSAIPRYITGESLSGGAGRTSSGLAMLMNNSSKVLQTVASNVDLDVMSPSLTGLYDMIMLTDQSGLLTGEEEISVNGVNVALQKETERQKQLQFLQITANPIDAPILGEVGRGRVLRAVSQNMGLPDDVVPDDATLEQEAKIRQMMAMQQAQVEAINTQNGQPSTQGKPSSGARAQGAQAPQATPARLADHAPAFNAFQQGSNQGAPNVGR
jgi:hypothetical protein